MMRYPTPSDDDLSEEEQIFFSSDSFVGGTVATAEESLDTHGTRETSHKSTTSSKFSLRRKSALLENEVVSTILKSSQARRRSQLLRTSTASMTINKLQVSKLGLIGRSKETNILRETLAKVSEIHEKDAYGKELLLISGYSGTGKSSLANVIREDVNLMDGIFVVGKFNLGAGGSDEPYSGIKLVCREICGLLLIQSSESTAVQNITRTLSEALGTDLMPLLLNVVPELEEVFTLLDFESCNYQRTNELSTRTTNQQQLVYVLRLFFRVISLHFKPLVIVFDDLQWADLASLDILGALLTDSESKGLMFIGCYRSNDVDENHIFMTCLRNLKAKTEEGNIFNITEMEIGNLDGDQVNEVVSTLLSIDQSNQKEVGRVQNLSDICFKRTHGNAFFVISFLQLLEQEKYLTFNFGSFKWNWDCEKIENETSSTENLVDVITGKINNVDDHLKEILKIASLLGSRFEKNTLLKVWKNINEADIPLDDSIEDFLSEAVNETFLEQERRSGYRWVHDKVQEAALSLIPRVELPTFQFQIGLILLRNSDPKEIDDLLFVIVDHLDAKEPDNEEISVEIAQLSLKAAMRARALSAFSTARKYAMIGVKHLPTPKWKVHYDLACKLHCSAAEAESIVGNSKALEFHSNEVISNCRSIEDKIPLFHILSTSLGKRNKQAEAVELCVESIKELGVTSIPSKMAMGVKGIMALRRYMKVLESFDIYQLPIMSEVKQIATMKLLDDISSFCFIKGDKITSLVATCKMVGLTLKYGISKSAPTCFGSLAIWTFAVFGDLRLSIKVNEMALTMTEMLQGDVNESLVIARTFGFALGYCRPFHDSLKELLRGYVEGRKYGDTEMSAWCVYTYMLCSFFSSKPLHNVEEDCRNYSSQALELGVVVCGECIRYLLQSVTYLIGEKAELFEEKQNLVGFFRSADSFFRSMAYAYSLNYEEGAKHALRTGETFWQVNPGHMSVQGEHFYRALCLFAMARKTKKKKYKKAATRIREKIRKWVKQGCVNANHHLLLLDAETAALRGKTTTASELYRKGIILASRSGLIHDNAVMCERYANFLLNDLGQIELAKTYAQESRNCFSEWGAHRSAENMRKKYPNLFLQRKSIRKSNISIPSFISALTTSSK